MNDHKKTEDWILDFMDRLSDMELEIKNLSRRLSDFEHLLPHGPFQSQGFATDAATEAVLRSRHYDKRRG